MLVVPFADCFDFIRVLGCLQCSFGGVFGDPFGLGVGEGHGAGEDAAGIDSVEGPGFGDGVEDLRFG